MAEDQIYDVTIIGGGPTGLFGLFYAGLRQMSAKVIDSLDELGGQLIALYPEKYIYDMPSHARVLAKDLVASMVEQGMQYGATAVLGQQVTTLERRENGDGGIWVLGTHKGEQHLTRTVVITAGAGSFAPVKLERTSVEEWEGKGIHYFVRDLNRFAGRRVLIVGGGDSAVDWALHLHPIAKSVTVIHRRDKWRAHELSVQELLESPVEVRVWWELEEVCGDDCVREVGIFENRSNEKHRFECDEIILSLGFKADLGPMRSWGLELKGNSIQVNSRMETNLPGVYAAGDVVNYDGKLKLIATGVGEAAVAVNLAKTVIDPTARLFPGHSTNMPDRVPVGVGDRGSKA